MADSKPRPQNATPPHIMLHKRNYLIDPPRGVLIGILAVIFVLVGFFGLRASHAATSVVATEAETGNLSGNTGAGDPNGASGNSSVKFSVAGTSPTPGMPPPITDGGKILWRGGAEEGKSAWSNEHDVNPNRITVVNNFNGRNAYKVFIQDGDDFTGERAELGQDDNRVNRAYAIGDDFWQGYSFWLTPGFPLGGWTAVTQWKDLPDLGSPSWETDVQNDNIELDGNLAGKVWGVPAKTGIWINMVVHMKVSKGSDGILDLYYSTGNDKPQLVYSRRAVTSRGATWLIPRMGYYRNPAISGTLPVYHAHWAVGTSFGAVNPVW